MLYMLYHIRFCLDLLSARKAGGRFLVDIRNRDLTWLGRPYDNTMLAC